MKNFVTVGRSHTEPIDEAIASVRCRVSTTVSLAFSAAVSGTPTRSYSWSSVGLSRCAEASVNFSQAGWSVRSWSVLVRTKATRSATDSKA